MKTPDHEACKLKSVKGLSIKDVRSQGERGLSTADILRTKGGGEVLQMRTSAIYGAKDIGFFEICGMSARTGGRI